MVRVLCWALAAWFAWRAVRVLRQVVDAMEVS